MTTVETIYRTYEEWGEVDKDVQKKCIEAHRDINVEGEWYIGEYQYWADKLGAMGYDVKETKYRDERKYDNGKWVNTGNRNAYISYNIQFSGFWSQGDGASFTGNIDIEKWIETQESVKYAKILEAIKNDKLEIEIAEITRTSTHYVHERSTTVHIDWSTSEDQSSPEEIEEIDKMMNQLQEDIESHHIGLNQEIYSDLEKTYDALTSDESVADTLIANEYEMNASGDIL